MSRTLLMAAILLPGLALAQVPNLLSHQGRLIKADGTPERGVVAATYRVFEEEGGGTAIWEETQMVALNDGFYSTVLGQTSTLPVGLFSRERRFLEMAVQGEALLPRQRLVSVPWALVAESARSVSGGPVVASSLVVGGRTVVDSSGQLISQAAEALAPKSHVHDAADLTSGVLDRSRIPQGAGSGLDADLLDGLDSRDFQRRIQGSCPTGYYVTAVDSDGNVACSPDAVGTGAITAVGVVHPLTVDGGSQPVIGLTTTCSTGQILKWSGSGWVCSPDADTLYAAGTGLTLSGGAFGLASCPAGQIFKSVGST